MGLGVGSIISFLLGRQLATTSVVWRQPGRELVMGGELVGFDKVEFGSA